MAPALPYLSSETLLAVESVRRWLKERRHDLRQQLKFMAFYRKHAAIFASDSALQGPGDKRVLFVSPRSPNLEINLALMKGLRTYGSSIVVLEANPRGFGRYFQLAGADTIMPLNRLPSLRPADIARATELIESCHSLEDLLLVKWQGIRVGRIAASTAIRKHRIGDLDLQNPTARDFLTRCLAKSLWAAEWAPSLIRSVQPTTAIFLATEYTPKGELFDACLGAGVDAIVLEDTHRNDSLFAKRYSGMDSHHHVASLSASTWSLARTMPWSEAERERLDAELEGGYLRGDWYGVARTQFDTRLVDAAETRRVLALEPEKMTAFIFAHILFDAPFNWAKPLYTSYERWLIETVRAACLNDSVNWVVKIHPANAVKLGGRDREPAETQVLAREFGSLPPHVKLMAADSHISTLSLFELMDRCVTVRGTIGIEAAARGIPVLTAADARYSGKGFTVDSASPAEYRQRLLRIQDIPRLTAPQQELAQRYAYALLVMRPLDFVSVSWDHGQPDRNGGLVRGPAARINVTSAEGWHHAPDLRSFAGWLAHSRDEDYLAPNRGDPSTSTYSLQVASGRNNA